MIFFYGYDSISLDNSKHGEIIRKLGIAFDCHNTLVDSNYAWTKAFVDYVGKEHEENILMDLFGRRLKRRDIATKYGVDYNLVEKQSYRYSNLNGKAFLLIESAHDIGIPVFVISNAPLENVVKDLQNVGIDSCFEKIFSKEDGGKSNTEIFDNILNDYGLEILLFIGNEEFDDNIPHPSVLSVVITDFLLQRFSIVRNKEVNEQGRIV